MLDNFNAAGGHMDESVTSIKIKVDGMSCGNCERRIEKAVGALEGVREVKASAPLLEVRVSYEPSAFSWRPSTRPSARQATRSAPGRKPPSGKPPQRSLRRRDLPFPRAHRRRGRRLPHHPLHGRLHLPADREPVHGLRPALRGRPAHLAALHRHVRGDRADPGNQALRAAGSIGPRPVARPRSFRTRLVPSLLYNGGRVISYTIIGGVVGALGSLFSLSTALKG